MINQFVLPCVESITYLRGAKVKNKAINLSLCAAIEKSRFRWYPDKEGVPCIFFYFEQGGKARWVYEREEDRDRDFDRIIKPHPTPEENGRKGALDALDRLYEENSEGLKPLADSTVELRQVLVIPQEDN